MICDYQNINPSAMSLVEQLHVGVMAFRKQNQTNIVNKPRCHNY